MKKKIGFIGVGKMGGGMASILLKNGYPLVVYDISDEAANAIVKLGADKANSPKEVAERSNVVISSLPGSQEVEEVYLGENGVLEGAKEGTTIIEVSTINPITTRKVAREALKKGVKMIDSPVSGSPKMAAEGTLTVLVGGDKDTFHECEDILHVFGKTVHYVGDIGSGHTVKLVNNIMSAGNVIVAAEAFILGVKAGVDPDRLYRVLSTCRGTSVHFEVRFKEKVLRGDFKPSFTTNYARKDAGFALELAKELKVPLPMASLALQLYTAASASGMGEEDFVSVIKLFEEYAGVKARSKDQ